MQIVIMSSVCPQLGASLAEALQQVKLSRQANTKIEARSLYRFRAGRRLRVLAKLGWRSAPSAFS